MARLITQALCLGLIIVSACATTGATVTTTSASVPGKCRAANAECFMDYDCCSNACDYDLHYCH